MDEGAMDLLKELKSMPITLHLLQSTRIGMSVNALRKQSTDEDVIALAKILPQHSDRSVFSFSSIKRQESVKTPTTPKITTFPPVPITCDTVRGKCREMLTSALQTDNDYVAIGADCEQLASQIEEYILSLFVALKTCWLGAPMGGGAFCWKLLRGC
uniref:Uncharacterized protein n=1 Tax=Pseudonaja textilis TaxID=8673 RepID=A0A670Z540_PSETE